MIEFFRNAFRGLFKFCLILGIIGLFIGVISAFGLNPLIGFLTLVISFIALIFSAGLISTILYMDEKLENMAIKINEMVKKPQLTQGDSTSPSSRIFTGSKYMKKCKRCQKMVDEDYTGCPHCGNNTFE